MMTLYNLVGGLATIFYSITMVSAGKVTNPTRVPKNAVLLSKVSSLTLRDGKLTSARRVDAIPQLECIGPKEICDLYKVDVMRCTNEGADYDAENIQWSCKASLPEEFKLGSTDVICEGYESSDDPYVLKGSCAVEYRLLLTDKGEEKYDSIYGKNWREPAGMDVNFGARPSSIGGIIFFLIFIGVLFMIVKGIWSQWNRNPPRLRGPGSGRGGHDDGNDPPPPYDDYPPSYYDQPRKPKTQTAAPRPGSSTYSSSSRTAPRGEQGPQGWRPGFWTGTAAGAAAGYLAGNRGQTRSEPQEPRVQRQPETQQRPGGFFSNFGTPQPRPAPASSASSSSNSAPTFSSTRHESTGFGSTRRR